MQVRISLFFVDGLTIIGWIPLLIFTVRVLLSDDAATVIVPGSSNNFLAFWKILGTQSHGNAEVFYQKVVFCVED